MDALKYFWYIFYIYLGIIVAITIYCIKFKISQKEQFKIMTIPSIIFGFSVFWIMGLPFWSIVILGSVLAVWVLYAPQRYYKGFKALGEAARGMLGEKLNKKRTVVQSKPETNETRFVLSLHFNDSSSSFEKHQ